MMDAVRGITGFDSDLTKKLIDSVLTGRGDQYLQSNRKVGILDLMKVLKCSNFNRAVRLGPHFLGLGKELKNE